MPACREPDPAEATESRELAGVPAGAGRRAAAGPARGARPVVRRVQLSRDRRNHQPPGRARPRARPPRLNESPRASAGARAGWRVTWGGRLACPRRQITGRRDAYPTTGKGNAMSERHTQNGSSHEGDRFPEELLTAYALGQLEGAERDEIERMLANPAQDSRTRTSCRNPATGWRTASSHRGVCGSFASTRFGRSPRDHRAAIRFRDCQVGGTASEAPTVVSIHVGSRRHRGFSVSGTGRSTVAEHSSRPRGWPANKVGKPSESSEFEDPQADPQRQPDVSTTTGEGDGYRDPPLATLSQPATTSEGQPWFEQEIQKQSESLTAGVAADVDSAAVQLELSKMGDETAPKNDLSGDGGCLQGQRCFRPWVSESRFTRYWWIAGAFRLCAARRFE